ncbi:MAG: DNA mismatch repair endonuclease MutL [Endomicrobiia bacterium]
MNRIKILPPEIYTRIAAGEIIERPSNVVKELLENSIDAKATKITIEVISAGKKLIRITDNGCGMSKEDLTLCVKPHATSKIENFEDIYNLSTLGFRGEALASIVNVSKTKIISKIKEEKIGYELVIHGGEIISFEECAANEGTIVEVRDLFYNVPARLKSLKSTYTEKIHIIKTVEEYAVAYNDIEFKLFSDNELILSFNPSISVVKRINDVFKKEIVQNLIYFEHKDEEIKIYGFISPLEHTQINKSLQMFYVNKRPVSSKILTQSLYDAYKDTLPTGRHPVGIIFIEIHPNKIDVNIHPKKRIIKFFDEEAIYNKIKTLLSEKIKYNLDSKKPISIDSYSKVNYVSEKNLNTSQKPLSIYTSYLPTDYSQNLIYENYKKIGIHRYIYLGQLNRTYLLFETNNGLTILDQHAASERILFERFTNENLKSSLQTQRLLFPVNIELKLSDFETIKPYIEELNKLGFEAIISGKSSLGFYSIPSVFEIDDIKDFISKFIENLISDIRSETNDITIKDKIIRSACRAAIKANQLLSLSQVENLLKDLSDCEQPFFCPHGRPTIINIEISEIEKFFLRKK